LGVEGRGRCGKHLERVGKKKKGVIYRGVKNQTSHTMQNKRPRETKKRNLGGRETFLEVHLRGFEKKRGESAREYMQPYWTVEARKKRRSLQN